MKEVISFNRRGNFKRGKNNSTNIFFGWFHWLFLLYLISFRLNFAVITNLETYLLIYCSYSFYAHYTFILISILISINSKMTQELSYGGFSASELVILVKWIKNWKEFQWSKIRRIKLLFYKKNRKVYAIV